MKKISFLILIIVTAGLLTGCKNNKMNGQNYGKTDYYISGLYIDYLHDNNENYTISDRNPKLYLDYLDGNMFNTNGGNTGLNVYFADMNRTITNDKDITNCILGANLVLPMNAQEQITVYQIHQDAQGNLTVYQKRHQTHSLKSASGYTFSSEFTINNKKYYLQISLKITVL